MLHSSLLRRARAFAAALALLTPSAAAQIIQPGDVIAVSETVSADTLRVYDGCTGALKTTFNDARWLSTGNGRYLEVAPDGMIWVGDRAQNRLYQYDRDLVPQSYVDIPCATGGDFAFDSSGRVVITSTGQPNGVGTFNPSGGGTPVCSVGLPEPWGLDVMPSGAGCISLHQLPGVLIVDPQTGTQLRSINCGDTLGRSWSVDALQNGLIVVSDWQNQCIRAVDPTQPPGSECVWSIQLNAPVYPHTGGLSVNEPLGRIYVAVFRNGEYWLEQYVLSTQQPIGVPTPMQPAGYAFPPPHNIVVVPEGLCSAAPVPFCFGDGTGLPCPCTNTGDHGHGCASSHPLLGGGRLSGSGLGMVSADTILLTADHLASGTSGLFFQGMTQVGPNGLGGWSGDGIRCVGTPVIRMAVRTATNNSMSYGFGNPQDAPVSVVGMLPASGGKRYYQVWYRDSNPTFCTPSLFNFTNGVSIDWQP